MDKKKLAEVEAKLHEAVGRVIDAGSYMNGGSHYGIQGQFDAEPGALRHDGYGCCLLGAVLFGHKVDGAYRADAAARILGIDHREARALEVGYMGVGGFYGCDEALLVLGKRMRATYYGGWAS